MKKKIKDLHREPPLIKYVSGGHYSSGEHGIVQKSMTIKTEDNKDESIDENELKSRLGWDRITEQRVENLRDFLIGKEIDTDNIIEEMGKLWDDNHPSLKKKNRKKR